MALYDVTEQVLTQASATAAHLDADRLMAIWRIICEENEEQAHLVTEAQWVDWVSFSDRITASLDAARTDSERVVILSPVAKALAGSASADTHSGYHGTKRPGVFHADLG